MAAIRLVLSPELTKSNALKVPDQSGLPNY
jgi:hypothetical protein